MKTFKKRKKLENATLFKVVYSAEDAFYEKDFTKRKTLDQWVARQSDCGFFMPLQYQALIDDEWIAYTTIGKKTLTIQDLETIMKDLKEVYKTSKTED